MRVAEVHSDVEAFLNSRTFEVEHAVENLVNVVKDLAVYRQQPPSREIMLTSECRVRITLALDGLQLIYDDLEGKL